jgi:hypothetical protein
MSRDAMKTSTLLLSALLGAFAGSLGAVAFSPAVLAQAADCNWYADTALKQQLQNEQRKCGFQGPEWSPSRQAHLAWCATQPPDRWTAEARKREKALAGCKR